VQSCTRTQKKEILRELGSCEQVAQELEKWSLLRLLRRSEQIERRTALKGRLFNIRKRLQLLEQFSYTNNEGFLYICKQIEDSLSKDLSDSCLSNFTTSMDCFCDVGEQSAPPPSLVEKYLLTSTKALTDSCVCRRRGRVRVYRTAHLLHPQEHRHRRRRNRGARKNASRPAHKFYGPSLICRSSFQSDVRHMEQSGVPQASGERGLSELVRRNIQPHHRRGRT